MNKNLVTITYYGTTKNLIDVVFTKGQAERRAVINRKDYEVWIERTDKNDVSFSYNNGDQVIAMPCTVQMENYWTEMSDEHIHSHLYDYIILNNLHYDEELQRANALAPTASRQNITASVPGLYGSKEALEDEQESDVAIAERMHNAY